MCASLPSTHPPSHICLHFTHLSMHTPLSSLSRKAGLDLKTRLLHHFSKFDPGPAPSSPSGNFKVKILSHRCTAFLSWKLRGGLYLCFNQPFHRLAQTPRNIQLSLHHFSPKCFLCFTKSCKSKEKPKTEENSGKEPTYLEGFCCWKVSSIGTKVGFRSTHES